MSKPVFAVLLGLVLALGAATAYLAATREPTRSELFEAVLADPKTRRLAVRELIDRSGGVWDSFGDADVGRILLPELEDREMRGVAISSNALGMREGWYASRKPVGVTRVVLLGDSYVFGAGVAAEDRLGVFLEERLREGMRRGGKVEVLHLGLSSWNVVAECAYVRRQLSDLAPDLVIQVTVDNDLEDVAGVRGFGEMAGFSPQVRGRGTARVGSLVPMAFAREILEHHMAFGVDWESRTRFARAEAEIARLAAALERRGAEYLLLLQWNDWNGIARERLGARLDDRRVAFVSKAFHFDPEHWITDRDRHWNRRGHERIAALLYALIGERALLPGHELEPRPAADAELAAIHGRALEEIADGGRATPDCTAHLTCPPESARMARQVYAGLDRDGSAGNYVSVVLAPDGDELVLAGESLDRDELRGARARVFVEEHEIGSFDLGPDATFPLTFPVPADVRSRPYVSVRIVSDDWVYGRVYHGHGISFRLRELRIR